MDARIDTGPILVDGTVAVQTGDTPLALDIRKTREAARCIDRVLDAIVNRDEGIPQPPGGGFFATEDRRRITTIEDPSTMTSAEMAKRLHAFSMLRMKLNDTWYPVTRLSPVSPRHAPGCRLTFTTRDGVSLKPTRLGYFPSPLYRAIRRFRMEPRS